MNEDIKNIIMEHAMDMLDEQNTQQMLRIQMANGLY